MNDRASDATAPATAVTPAAPQAPPGGATSAPPDGSIKETIESIVIAFILAFIFRGFIVEAFVIPTGSMAPTLLGAHMRFTCPDCGYRYDVNYQSEGGLDVEDVNIPSHAVVREIDPRTGRFTGRAANRVLSINCPNCGFKIPRVDPHDAANDATAPPVRYGDRILVLKYLYLLTEPRRWDVVVFKAPVNPDKYDYGQNYIKRLVGRPGESVYILDGDIYIGKPGAPAGEYEVQTKPRHVQDALWRIVYDNDYLPRGLGHWTQPWQAKPEETGWKTDGRQFTFDNMAGGSTLRFNADANPDKHALTDWLAYDVSAMQQARRETDTFHTRSYEPHNNVSDLRLSFYYRREAGDGPLTLVMSKLDQEFSARLTPEGAQLLMRRDDQDAVPIGDVVPLSLRAGCAAHVELVNADYQVELRIDGRLVARTTRDQYRPDIPRLMTAAEKHEREPRPRVQIVAERQRATLSHVSLWRDVYYLNREEVQGGGPVHWASPMNFPEHVMRLGEDEYFVLGDNSLLSGDARTWREPIALPDENLFAEDGRVPGRFMIGKAFFVYWPAGYRPIDSAPALVPNFGDMRFIH